VAQERTVHGLPVGDVRTLVKLTLGTYLSATMTSRPSCCSADQARLLIARLWRCALARLRRASYARPRSAESSSSLAVVKYRSDAMLCVSPPSTSLQETWL
jgi:hypothetical protein